MKEIREALRRCVEQQQPCVVATIVRVEGSAYRREGARCVIFPSGEIVGILSGGCVEEDIREHAFEVLRGGEPRMVEYDMRAGGDEPWGLGMGCNGAVAVWLERFDPVAEPEAADAMLRDFEARVASETGFRAYTVIASGDPERYKPGQRWREPLDSAPGLFELPPERVPGIAAAQIGGNAVEAFVEAVPPAPLLTIIGAGADVEYLCRAASLLEWKTRVVYHRTARAVKEHFPHAGELVHVPRADFSALADRPQQYVVVMTHHLELDREAVRQLLPLEGVVYLGVLGSRSRIRQIVEYAAGAGSLRPDWLDKLHAPVGLDIGAATPQEIALSIMAEIVARRNGRPGGPLRNRRDLAGGVLCAADGGRA